MEQKNLLTIDISKQDHKDLISFCELNEITDIDGFVKLCFRKGYYIERYGLLNQGNLPEVIDREFEKEVVVEDNSTCFARLDSTIGFNGPITSS